MKRQALILGTGGHCRVLLSLLAARGEHEMLGIVDLGEFRVGEFIMGVPVIGKITCLEAFRKLQNLHVFLAIGDNTLRQSWWQTASDLGFALPSLVSPQAIIDPHAQLGRSNVVCANAFIGPEAVLGDNNLINTAAIVEHEVRIGSHCHLAPSSTVCGRSQIGDACVVGVGATVIDYVEVAARITIGAGATVIGSIIEPGGIYIGTPAKKKGSR